MNEKVLKESLDKLVLKLYTLKKLTFKDKILKYLFYILVFCILVIMPLLLPAYYEMNILVIFGLWFVLLIFMMKLISDRRKYIVRKFYKYEDITGRVKVCDLKDTTVLNELAIMMEIRNDFYFNRFNYHWLYHNGVLKDEVLKIYTLTGKELKKYYDYKGKDDRSIMIISSRDLNLNEERITQLTKEMKTVGGKWINENFS